MIPSRLARALAVAASLCAAPALAETPELGPLVSGTPAYLDGTFVWTDYAYDDRGGNTNDVPGGDATYPPDPYPGNTADLIQVQLGTGPGGELEVAIVLETLLPGADVAVGIGLNTDRSQVTGAAFVPGGQWTPLQPLGLEHVIVLSSASSTATLMTWQGAAWQTVGSSPATVDRDRNVLRALVPLLHPGTATWHVVGVAGWADAMGSWANGAHPIYDLAFVRAEDPAQETLIALGEQVPQVRQPWQDFLQSDILGANELPIAAIATVAFGTAQTSVPPVGHGLHTFLYHSRIDLGEGVRASPLQFRGPYQPYVVMIPSGLPVPPPVVVFMHGANQNHLVNAIHFSPEGVAVEGTYSVPAVITFPLGRDPKRTGLGSAATWRTGSSGLRKKLTAGLRECRRLTGSGGALLASSLPIDSGPSVVTSRCREAAVHRPWPAWGHPRRLPCRSRRRRQRRHRRLRPLERQRTPLP